MRTDLSELYRTAGDKLWLDALGENEFAVLKDDIFPVLSEYVKLRSRCYVRGNASASKWISVKDRLPDLGNWVIISSKSCGIMEAKLSNVGKSAGVVHFCDKSHAYYTDVAYWMLLPEPPEQKKPFRTNEIDGVSCIYFFEGDRCKEVAGYLLDGSLAKGITGKLNEIWEKHDRPTGLQICPCVPDDTLPFYIRTIGGETLLYFQKKQSVNEGVTTWFALDDISDKLDKFLTWLNALGEL